MIKNSAFIDGDRENKGILGEMLSEVKEKVNEINEITENISLMYNKEIFIDCLEYFDGAQINDVFLHLAQSNNKYSGLSSKAKFKFMDIVGI